MCILSHIYSSRECARISRTLEISPSIQLLQSKAEQQQAEFYLYFFMAAVDLLLLLTVMYV